MAERYRIEELKFSDGTQVKLGNLTVLVGPNNCGKSRALKEIVDWTCALPGEVKSTPVVVTSVRTERPSTQGALAALYGITARLQRDRSEMWYIRPALRGTGHVTFNGRWPEDFGSGSAQQHFGYFAQQLTTFLSTENRLTMVASGNAADNRESAETLLQVLYSQGSARAREICEIVAGAFPGLQTALDYSVPRALQFRVGSDVANHPSDPRDALSFFDSRSRLDEQGDGLRSYVGIVTALVTLRRPVLLIDEPEAFLHPPQAFRLGQFIASQVSNDRQIIIATHSADVLRGIIFHSSDAQIIRIDRVDNKNSVRVLDKDELHGVAADPLLSAAGVLDGLFSSVVIVTEADADSRFYHSISRKIAPGLDVHFVNADNKQTVPKVLNTYRRLGVRCAGIVDVDVLNNAGEFTKQVNAAGIVGADRGRLLELRDQIAEEIDEMPVDDRLASAKAQLAEMIALVSAAEAAPRSEKEKAVLQLRPKLERLKADTAAWQKVKREGRNALNKTRAAFDELLVRCGSVGLFINPLGELESSLSEFGIRWQSDKRAWLLQALQLVPSLQPDATKEPWKLMANVHDRLKVG